MGVYRTKKDIDKQFHGREVPTVKASVPPLYNADESVSGDSDNHECARHSRSFHLNQFKKKIRP